MSNRTEGPPRKKVRRAMEDGPELKSKPVLIRVGETKEEYHVHENILRSNSSFFDNALTKEWKEGQDRAIDLPEADNEAFEIWIKWLYTGTIFLTRLNDVSDDKNMSNEFPRWDACYALGDFLQDNDFKDACIDAVIEYVFFTTMQPTLLPKMIYEQSTQESNHRKLVVDVFVYGRTWTRSNWITEAEFPTQFLLDVIKFIGPILDSGKKTPNFHDFFNLDDTCKYHDHGPDKPCYRIKPAFRL